MSPRSWRSALHLGRTAVLLLLVAGNVEAIAGEITLHVLWDAQVIGVSCHAPRHQGHDYSIMGDVVLSARAPGEDRTRRREVRASIVVSRLSEEGEADGQALCRELRDLKETGRHADILFQRVTSNLVQPLRAIRAITKLRGVDENDRMDAGE